MDSLEMSSVHVSVPVHRVVRWLAAIGKHLEKQREYNRLNSRMSVLQDTISGRDRKPKANLMLDGVHSSDSKRRNVS